MKRYLKLVTLACAGAAACATPQNSVSVAPASACTPGTIGMAALTPRDRAEITAAVAALDGGEAPVLVHVTERSAKPTLLNGPVVGRLLERHFPPDLLDRRQSGTVTLLMQIGESGSVSRLSVLKPALHSAFDEAAMRVAAGMEFRPARHAGCAIPIWVLLPITFTAPAR